MTLLCKIENLNTDQVFSVEHSKKSFLICVTDGCVSVFINSCPHLGIPLEWQPQDFICKDTELIRCSTHGALFLRDTGECVSGPCQGQSLTACRFSITDKNEIHLET